MPPRGFYRGNDESPAGHRGIPDERVETGEALTGAVLDNPRDEASALIRSRGQAAASGRRLRAPAADVEPTGGP